MNTKMNKYEEKKNKIYHDWFNLRDIILSSLAAKLYQSRPSLLISHWVHEKDCDVRFLLIGSKEMIWITLFALKTTGQGLLVYSYS